METPQTQLQIPSSAKTEAAPQRRAVLPLLILLLIAANGVIWGTLFLFNGSPSAPKTQVAATTAAYDAFAGVPLEAKSVYVYDIKTHKVLYNKNAESQMPLASLTKIPLALVAAEVFPEDRMVRIDRDVALSSTEKLIAGDMWRVRDILDYTLAASSNAGADTIALLANNPIHAKYSQSPATNAVLWRMNELAKELHLNNTYFLNTSGLDISETQSGAYGSAHDVADLMTYIANTQPEVFSSTTHEASTYKSLEGHTIKAVNTDEALASIPNMILGKTGLTDLAGGNLAIVFDVGLSHPVVAVVLGSSASGRFEDMKKIIASTQTAIAHEQ